MGTEPNYVVSLIAPLPEAEANAVASRLSDRLGLPGDRLARLLARRAGAITKPLSREAAARIAATLEDAGVPVLVERVVEPERSTSTRWIGFDPSDVSDEAFNAGWAQPRPNRAAQAPRPEISSGRDDASSRRSRPLVTSSRYSRPPPDEEPMFDWNQPIGYARWRRPAMLIALLVAIGIFVLLQVSGSTPQPTAKSAGAYEGGLAAYRLGDFRRALQVWEDVGSTGDARALYMLGYMSEFGQGQEWSNRRAAEYYRQAAERGSARAQFALASLYERGLGVPHSPRTAVRWYRLAAENGHAEAQYRFALAHLQGRGADRDYALALEWFEQAAANGIRDADAFVMLLRALPQAAVLSFGSNPASDRDSGSDSNTVADPASEANSDSNAAADSDLGSGSNSTP